jgi:hypothetical protein
MPADSQGREALCPQCQHVFVVEPASAITSQPAMPVLIRAGESPPYRNDSDAGPFDDLNVDNRFASFHRYRAGGGLATTAKAFFVLILLSEMALLGSNYLQYELSVRLLANVPVADAELNSNDQRQMALGIAHFVIFIASAIVFVVWFYRVHANLEPLGAHGLKYTPGWAAGSFFVPILNLFRPVQIAQEIWRNSDPDAVESGRVHMEASPNSVLIGFWWAAWIVCNLLSNVALRMPVNSPVTLQSATQMQMVSGAASMVAASLALIMIWNIDARQTARADAIQAALNRGDDEGHFVSPRVD